MSCQDCNDCNQSPVYPVNIPIPGASGSSAYVYIAFATTVALVGTPGSNATGGFLNNQPGPNSAFLAIRTVTTPVVGSPTSAFFNGYWVPLQGVSLSGINLKDDGVAVAGGPFNTVNFQGSGLTGVTVTDNGGSQATVDIVTPSLIKISYSALDALRIANTLIVGASYWIYDAGDAEGSNGGVYKEECSATYYTNPNFAHNAGIIVRAISTSQFANEAIYLARVPGRQTAATVFKKGNSYVVGAEVVSYNQVFTCINNITANVEPADDPTNWSYKFKDSNQYYITEAQLCIYQFTSQSPYGTVKARWDSRGNILRNTNPASTSNEFMKKVFRGGYDNSFNNVINFSDDSTRRPLADTSRSPLFNAQQVNYNNLYSFANNTIDTQLPPNKDATADVVSYGTRFIDVYIDNTGEFTGNNLNNAVISNISDSVRFIGNTVRNSIFYNTNFSICRQNIFDNNTVIGDLSYRTEITSTYGSYAYLLENNFTNVTTEAIVNNLGSKTWDVINNTNTGVINLGGGGTEINFIVPTYAVVGDKLKITSNTINPAINNILYTVTAIVNSSTVRIAQTLPIGIGNITATFYSASIKTSFVKFENNTINGSVLRGLNKNVATNGTNFSNNTITNSFFENYTVRLVEIPSVAEDKYAYSNPGNEVGLNTGVVNNTISNSVFLGNKLTYAFINNTINGASFFINNDRTTPRGIVGDFRNNNIQAKVGNNANVLFPLGCRFTLCTVSPAGWFAYNNITGDNIFYNLTVEAGAYIWYNNFVGRQGIAVGGNGDFVNNPGLSNVTVKAGVQMIAMNFEGREPRLSNLIIQTTSNAKEVYNLRNMQYCTIRDLKIDAANKGAVYNELRPQLFTGNINPVVNISNVAESVASATTIGGTVYQTATFTMQITTQYPHLINPLWTVAGGGPSDREISLQIGGFTTMTLASATGPGGTGLINTVNAPSTVNTGTAKVTGVIDMYNITVEVTNVYNPINGGQGWLLHSSQPGGGPSFPLGSGNYSINNDPSGALVFNYWYNVAPAQSFYTTSSLGIGSIIAPGVYEINTRIPMLASPADYTYAASSIGSRKYYVARDYNAAGAPTEWLYNGTTKTVNLPHFFDNTGGTVVFGSSVAATYEVDIINYMPENVPIRFTALPGCAVQFNLQPCNAPVAVNKIVDVNNQNTLTIQSYFTNTVASPTGRFSIYDEIILIRRGNIIKVDDRVIHTP